MEGGIGIIFERPTNVGGVTYHKIPFCAAAVDICFFR
jgi:hypothetical protein